MVDCLGVAARQDGVVVLELGRFLPDRAAYIDAIPEAARCFSFMSDSVHRITVQLREPSGSDPGQVTEGFYILRDGLLIMTEANGDSIRRDGGGEVSRAIGNATPDQVRGMASIMTREVRRMLLGMSETEERFRQPLRYGRVGIA